MARRVAYSLYIDSPQRLERNMNATALAQAARYYAQPYAAMLSTAITAELEQAYVARWLMQQDESVLSAAAVTATTALFLLAA